MCPDFQATGFSRFLFYFSNNSLCSLSAPSSFVCPPNARIPRVQSTPLSALYSSFHRLYHLLHHHLDSERSIVALFYINYLTSQHEYMKDQIKHSRGENQAPNHSLHLHFLYEPGYSSWSLCPMHTPLALSQLTLPRSPC